MKNYTLILLHILVKQLPLGIVPCLWNPPIALQGKLSMHALASLATYGYAEVNVNGIYRATKKGIAYAEANANPATESSEDKVREAIDNAMAYNLSLDQAKLMLEPKITLSDQSCQSIAKNYPYSWLDIKKVFGSHPTTEL